MPDSPDTLSRALYGLDPIQRDVYLLRRLRDLENLVVQLGAEIQGLRDVAHAHLAAPPPPPRQNYYDSLGDLR